MRTFFDIGANFGHDSINVARSDSNVIVYAFEPTPELANHLINSTKDISDRYIVVDKAVSDFNGTARFGIADHIGSNWGCSSLNEFKDNLEEAWPGRSDLKFNRHIDVEVVRLDSWLQNNNVKVINYFHCDVQGSDLKVLQGMGDYIHMIEQGVVESAFNERGKLYKENHTMEETIKFLESKDFLITNILSNDYAGTPNEVNIYFKNKRVI